MMEATNVNSCGLWVVAVTWIFLILLTEYIYHDSEFHIQTFENLYIDNNMEKAYNNIQDSITSVCVTTYQIKSFTTDAHAIYIRLPLS